MFTRDYYEDGVRKHISGYEDYKWMPTRSIPEALDIQNHFSFNTCVDYGCAKGFLVHALRLLGSRRGEDIFISRELSSCQRLCVSPNDNTYDLLSVKMFLSTLRRKTSFSSSFKKKADQFFFVIPLGDNDRFRIREYEVDVNHVTKKDEEWLIKMFESKDMQLVQFSYSLGSIKEKWIEPHPHGNGFFILRNNDWI